MRDPNVIEADEVLAEGAFVDEREHHPLPERWLKLPWLAGGGPAPKAPPLREEHVPENAAMRDFLGEELDPGIASTEAAFRRRHGIDADEQLSPATVETAIKRRAEERRSASPDPFDFDT